MAKKEYDVAKRFTEVARRAREIDTAPKKKVVPERTLTQSEIDYNTRPGRFTGSNTGKDVNLSIETASPEVRKRIAESLRKKR